MGTAKYIFGPYEFDLRSGILRKYGIRIKLQGKPQKILTALLERPGETVTRSDLHARLWPQDTFVDFDRGLNVAIKKLRDALCDSADSPLYIVTEPGVGYRFVAVVEVSSLSEALQEQESSASDAPDQTVTNNSTPSPPSRSASHRHWIALAVVLTAVLAVSLAAFVVLPIHPVRARAVRAVITLPAELRLVTSGENAALAFSPDGNSIVFSAIGPNGKSMLWLRRLDSLTPAPLPGTETAGFPFWSPDGKKLGFFTDLELRQVDLTTGAVTRICDASSGRGGAWTRDGNILFARSTRSAIYKINAAGGEPVAVTHLDEARYTTHRWPYLLPDGKHFVFLAANHAESAKPASLLLGDIDGSPERLLATADTNAVAVADHLVFVSGGKLVSQKLNQLTWSLEPNETVLAESVDYDPGLWLSGMAVSGDSLLYRKRSEGSSRQTVAWFDRRGNWLANAGQPGTYRALALSPDGQEIATLCGDPDVNLCLLHSDGSITQVTNAPIVESIAWAPDSARVAYGLHEADGRFKVAIKDLNLRDPERTVLDTVPDTAPASFHPDRRHLLLIRSDQSNGSGLVVLDLDTDKEREYLSARPGLLNAQFSPDGKWVAYSSRESGRDDVYVVSFPSPVTRYKVSSASGVAPHWRKDGRELYFLSSDDTLMAVSITSEKNRLAFSSPRPLFRPAIFAAPWDRNSYDVYPDGSKFAVNTVSNTNSDLVIVTSWTNSM